MSQRTAPASCGWARPFAAIIPAVAAAVLLSTPVTAQKPSTSPAIESEAGANAGDHLFDIAKVHSLHLSISAAEWAVLQTSNARGGGAIGGSDYRLADGRLVHVGSGFAGYFPWVHADMRVDSAAFTDVGLRYKGNLSFMSSSAAAPLAASFKLKIDLHGGKGSWDGEKTFNFHAGVVDTSKMREAIAYAVFRAAGVPASRTAYVEIFFTVPGLYKDTSGGLYVMIEDVNKKFLTRVLPPGGGLLMKPEGLRGGVQDRGDAWASYTPTFRPDRDATLHEQQRVMEFAKLVSQSDVALFRSKIGTYLDVDEFLRFVAVNALLVNTDSYLNGSHNFYLYLDPKDDKFRFIPWDLDLALGSRNNGGNVNLLMPLRGDNPLIYWLLDDPANAAKYRAILRELAATVFTAAEMTKLCDQLEQAGGGRAVSPRSFIAGQVAYVQQVIAGLGSK